MYLAQLALRDFRSYESVELALEPGATAFVGPNGEGKTNLLEAVDYVATLGSHRVATDAPLVRRGADRAVLRAGVQREGRAQLVELEINPGASNRARVNRSPLTRARDVLGTLRTVLFAPEDLSLVKGDPSERRRFLDDLTVACAPRHAGVRSDYERVLKQRNALLKSAGSKAKRPSNEMLGTLEVWDAHLARSGAELLAARLELLARLRPLVDRAYTAIAGDGSGTVDLDYRGSLGSGAELTGDRERMAAALREEMAESRRSELERGVSLVGPHRDDLVLGLGELPARGYASHGESWSLALGLRIASYELLRAEGDDPVLLLDDVFAELDRTRRARLAEVAAGAEQVLVTAAVAEDVPEQLAGNRYVVAAGEVRGD